eukprot:scaffold16711_cov90-Isochrysis_galbana.AAC.3
MSTHPIYNWSPSIATDGRQRAEGSGPGWRLVRPWREGRRAPPPAPKARLACSRTANAAAKRGSISAVGRIAAAAAKHASAHAAARVWSRGGEAPACDRHVDPVPPASSCRAAVSAAPCAGGGSRLACSDARERAVRQRASRRHACRPAARSAVQASSTSGSQANKPVDVWKSGTDESSTPLSVIAAEAAASQPTASSVSSFGGAKRAAVVRRKQDA